MRDVQKERDMRNVAIDRVGVRDVSYPIVVKDPKNGTQSTIATVSMSVLLPHDYRGTHMSRFIETLEAFQKKIAPSTLEHLTEHLRLRLDATEADIELVFPYFVRKKAPVSGIESFMRYEVCLQGFYCQETFDMIIGVKAPVQTLCPCSKEISSYGAHNQRASVFLKVRIRELVWFEELIEMIENASSAPLYTLLKREDEKFVTEQAYDNPQFVEDVVRDLAVTLSKDDRVTWYSISVTSAESIHNHDAFAEVTQDKRTKE
ncbi:MAG: GTP cyclohydrolase I FolE2 [Fretibacterium sp.]|nr:GTP cyclohydrolase I FolE2 [Fretibacterium sp.]